MCLVHRSKRSGDGTVSASSTLQKNDLYLQSNPNASDTDPSDAMNSAYYAYATAGPRRYVEVETTGNPLYQSVSSPEKSEDPTYDRIREKPPDSPKYDRIPLDSNPAYLLTEEDDKRPTQLTSEV